MELHDAYEATFGEYSDGTPIIKTFYKPKWDYPNRGIYRKNSPQKRHVENPNLYAGENPLRPGVRNIRIPKKKRKTAWKRFKKHFPYIEITETGKKIYNPLREIVEYPLKPQPKKIIN